MINNKNEANMFRKLADLIESGKIRIKSLSYDNVLSWMDLYSKSDIMSYPEFPPDINFEVKFAMPFNMIESINIYKEILFSLGFEEKNESSSL